MELVSMRSRDSSTRHPFRKSVLRLAFRYKGLVPPTQQCFDPPEGAGRTVVLSRIRQKRLATLVCCSQGNSPETQPNLGYAVLCQLRNDRKTGGLPGRSLQPRATLYSIHAVAAAPIDRRDKCCGRPARMEKARSTCLFCAGGSEANGPQFHE